MGAEPPTATTYTITPVALTVGRFGTTRRETIDSTQPRYVNDPLNNQRVKVREVRILGSATVTDPALAAEINALLARKMSAGEAEYGARYPHLHAYIEAALASARAPAGFRRPTGDPALLDRLLYDTVCASGADAHEEMLHEHA